MNKPKSTSDTPAWLVVAGLGLALVAVVMITYGLATAPPKDHLEVLAGTVVHSYNDCRRNGSCEVVIDLRTSEGETWIRQHDFAGNPPIVGPGVEITALVSPGGVGPVFWELRHGADLLFSYDDSSSAARAHYRAYSAPGKIAATMAVVLLVIGFGIGIQKGAWRINK